MKKNQINVVKSKLVWLIKHPSGEFVFGQPVFKNWTTKFRCNALQFKSKKDCEKYIDGLYHKYDLKIHLKPEPFYIPVLPEDEIYGRDEY